MIYEYKVVPAPVRARKIRGARDAADRFALTLAATLNEMAQDGWEFLRAETLPYEERHGLTGLKSGFQTMLVFRKPGATGRSETAEALRLLEDQRAAPHADDDTTG